MARIQIKMIMTTEINGIMYAVHPIYDLYAFDEDGNVIHIFKREPPHRSNKVHSGYLLYSVRRYGQPVRKTYQVHRFVWECFNGMIPDGRVIRKTIGYA